MDGLLLAKMNSTPDGEFQKYATEPGSYIRERFFGPDPRLRRMVEHLTDEDLQNLPRGGHDLRKLYAAYKLACEQTGAPTAILAKTVKGWKLGPEIESRNATHQMKKMTMSQFVALRNRLRLREEIPDAMLDGDLPPYYRPADGSPELAYMLDRRRALGGPIPRRTVGSRPVRLPDPKVFAEMTEGSGKQPVSTTMAFARILRNLVRDQTMGQYVAPIVPDEARTFGWEPLIAEVKIYAPEGQSYTPVDSDLVLNYAESRSGQVLEEGITEAGAMASFIALATSYSSWATPMLPIFAFYSMFGFQRFGDLAWLLGDARGRGILAGCTAGRTTLLGEGLQHDDGHSPLLASVNPAARIYDPSFAFELAVIIEEAAAKILGPDPEDRFWYLTLYNENYQMPPISSVAGFGSRFTLEEVRSGIVQGAYLFSDRPTAELPTGTGSDLGGKPGLGASILFSGPMWQVAQQAQLDLWSRYKIAADTWSVTSYSELRNDALKAERHSRLHPGAEAIVPTISRLLGASIDPVVAVSDYVRAVPDQVSRWIERPYTSLGTDGFGMSDTRIALRHHFEIDAGHVVIAVLAELSSQGRIDKDRVEDALAHYGVNPDLPEPWLA